MVKRVAARAGVENLHPHRYRHTFITNMVESDVNQTTIEHMVGVRQIPRTYLNKIGDKAAQKAHRLHSPAAKLARKMGRLR